jgi:hypothetical protein
LPFSALSFSFTNPSGKELRERKKRRKKEKKKQLISLVYLTLLRLAVPSWQTDSYIRLSLRLAVMLFKKLV